jgi:hypothetical protein
VWRSDTEKRAVSCLLDLESPVESLSWDDLDAFMGHRSQKMRPGGHAKTPHSNKSSKSASAASTTASTGGSGRRWFDDDKGDENGRPRPASTSASSLPSRRANAQSWGNLPPHSSSSPNNNMHSSHLRSNYDTHSPERDPDRARITMGVMQGKSWQGNRRGENEYPRDGPWHGTDHADNLPSRRMLYTSAGCRTDELSSVTRRRSNSMYEAGGNTKYLFNAPGRLLSSLSVNEQQQQQQQQQPEFQTQQQLLFNSKYIAAPNTQHHHTGMTDQYGNEWDASQQQQGPHLNPRTSLMLAQTYCAARHIEMDPPKSNHLVHMPMSATGKNCEKTARLHTTGTGAAPGEPFAVSDSSRENHLVHRQHQMTLHGFMAAKGGDGFKMARDHGGDVGSGSSNSGMRYQHNDAAMFAQASSSAAMNKYTTHHADADAHAHKRDALSLRRPDSTMHIDADARAQKLDALNVRRSRSSIAFVQVDKMLQCDDEYVLPRRSKGFTGCSGAKRENIHVLCTCVCEHVCVCESEYVLPHRRKPFIRFSGEKCVKFCVLSTCECVYACMYVCVCESENVLPHRRKSFHKIEWGEM